MKKIMFIMTKFGGTGWGGAHKVSVMLANYLSRNGYDVSIAVSEHARIDYPIDSAIKKYFLCDLYKQSNTRAINLLKKMKAFRSLCKQNKIDLVVGFTSNMAIYAIMAAVFSKRKSLISERTDPHIEPRKKILRGLRNMLFCLADKVVFQTPGARDYFPKIVRKKSWIIPNPISNDLPAVYNGEREKRIVNFCRIAPQKNLQVLFQAFDIFYEQHPQYTLEIYGDAKEGSEYITNLTKFLAGLKSKNHISIYGARQDIHEHIFNATAFASSSDYEGISNSMLEAMAIGLPVVVTDCQNGGERMCIEDGESGLIVPRNNPEAIAHALCRIVEDKEFADKISKNAVKIKDRFSYSKIFNLWEEIIEKV